jgi:hypothetical protein
LSVEQAQKLLRAAAEQRPNGDPALPVRPEMAHVSFALMDLS